MKEKLYILCLLLIQMIVPPEKYISKSVHYTGVWYAILKGNSLKLFNTPSLNVGTSGGMTGIQTLSFCPYVLKHVL